MMEILEVVNRPKRTGIVVSRWTTVASVLLVLFGVGVGFYEGTVQWGLVGKGLIAFTLNYGWHKRECHKYQNEMRKWNKSFEEAGLKDYA